MSDANPYALDHLKGPAIDAPADARLAFLRRTYGLLFAGVLVIVATMWAAGTIPAVQGMMTSLWGVISRGWVGWLVYAGVFMGGAALVHAFAEKKPLNLVLFFGYSFVLGLLLAPIVLYAAANSPQVLNQAAMLTLAIFGGLTGFVFYTGKDFSFLRGILFVGLIALIAVAILGAIMGWNLGLAFSAAAILLFAGYILYDTSQVLHHYPTTMHVSAACVLLTDLFIMFKHVLYLLMSLNDD